MEPITVIEESTALLNQGVAPQGNDKLVSICDDFKQEKACCNCKGNK